MRGTSLGLGQEGNRSPEVWGLQSHEVSMGRLNLLTGKTHSTSCGKWLLFPSVKQVRNINHLRPELGNLRVCTQPKDSMKAYVHVRGGKLGRAPWFQCHSPLQICTTPMMMIRARARSFPAVKMSWTLVAHRTLEQLTHVRSTEMKDPQTYPQGP